MPGEAGSIFYANSAPDGGLNWIDPSLTTYGVLDSQSSSARSPVFMGSERSTPSLESTRGMQSESWATDLQQTFATDRFLPYPYINPTTGLPWIDSSASQSSELSQLKSWSGQPAPTRADILGDALLMPSREITPIKLVAQWTKRDASYFNEIGVFEIDSEGRVNGVKPGEKDFAKAALFSSSRKVLIESNQKAGSWRSFNANPGSRLAFYLIPNSSSEQWIDAYNKDPNGAKPVFFSLQGANEDGVDHVKISEIGHGIWQMRWEDMTGGGDEDFNDAEFNISRQGLLVPGRYGQTIPLSIQFKKSETGYKNEAGLYFVDSPNGEIDSIRPGEEGYNEAALRRGRHMVLSGAGERSLDVTVDVPAGAYIGWYLVADGSSSQPFAGGGASPHIFFSYDEANRDGLTHFYAVGNSLTWAWEDHYGDGDLDFSDVVIFFGFGKAKSAIDDRR